MNKILFVFLVLAIVASVVVVSSTGLEEVQPEVDWSSVRNDNVAIQQRGFILNSQAKTAVRNTLKHMPCGWPEKGIPPLAPYRSEALDSNITTSYARVILQAARFQVDGLDDMEIKKLDVNYVWRKTVKFHFNFKNISASARRLYTNAFIDLMKDYGVSIRFEGTGDMSNFSLHDLSLKGSFRYEMPIIFDSVRIHHFHCVATLGSVTSNINGLGSERYNRMVNEAIEDILPKMVNDRQAEISEMIEKIVVPTVNDSMQGKKIWNVLWRMISSSPPKCVPPADPWAEQ